MLKKLIVAILVIVAFTGVLMFSTVSTRADSNTNSEMNVNAPQGQGNNVQPNSTIKNWHEVN
ncbi:MAG: hypothetical protein D6734_10545 [Candidatus Schekmanbacteria bacterium]|nr:MAG: hypothetical protein D6734_10545 [Candidatus Schekmanbacteria bacterium]